MRRGRLSQSANRTCPMAAEAVFLPLTNIELSSHVDDGSSSSQSMLNGIGQCESFSHQCTIWPKMITDVSLKLIPKH